MKYIIEADTFKLSCEIEKFSEKYIYNDTILHVSITSMTGNGTLGCSFCTDMEIDFNEFMEFSNDLKLLYDTLKGTATIKECFKKQYIEFSSDKRGYIFIKGYLCDDSGFEQELKFSNSFEPSYLTSFVEKLTNNLNRNK